MIRVRFAPSPTGYLHIGGARTALFNWMYAKSQDGQFILRIEDTDLVRSKKEFVDEILDSLQWLGLKWDELYFQSQRFDIYREHADKLLAEGKAYKDGEAVILKIPEQTIKLYDLIRAEIQFESAQLKDQVLIKSDGSPTYSFACVVDDALMNISCVIRGEDHISNTPKQMVMYQALGFKTPKFAHLPLIMGEEGGRLSKRTGATAVTDYRKMGFLPEAIVNYLMLLGWSPGGNQEVVKMTTALKNFSIKKINKSGAIFSIEKLEWINSQYIKQTDAGSLTKMILPFLQERGISLEKMAGMNLERGGDLYKPRLGTLTDFLEWTQFIFVDELQIRVELKTKFFSKDLSKEFNLLAERLNQVADFTSRACEEAFRNVVAEFQIKAADLVHPLRVALTGNEVGPGLFDTMSVLGKEKTVKRLKAV